MNPLAAYLRSQLRGGMEYPDAVQLCLRLYCTVDGVPKTLLPISKKTLAEAFSQLGGSGWVLATNEQVANREHWLKIIATIFQDGPVAINFERAEVVAKKVGFVKC